MPYKKSTIPNFRKAVGNLGKVAPRIAHQMVLEFAHKECEAFIEAIKAQSFPSFDATPLSEAWAARKAALKLDPRTMIASSNYVSKIRVIEQPQEDGTKLIYIGFADTDMAKDSHGHITTFPLWLLAAVQEYGSIKANVPARAHWGVWLEGMSKRAIPLRKGIAKQIMQRI